MGYTSVAEKIYTKAHFKSDCGIVAMLLERLDIVHSRFNCNRATQEESISNLYARTNIIIIMICVNKIATSTEEDTILFYILTTARTKVNLIGHTILTAVIITYMGIYHQISSHEIT